MDWIELESLPKETLIKIIKMYSKNWMTVDGLWFQNVEDKYGLDAAMEIDLKMWERQALIEAKRIKETLNFTGEGPLAVMQAYLLMTPVLAFALPEYEEKSPEKVVINYPSCPIQEARLRQGRGEFPCKPTGAIMLSSCAQVMDPRVKVKCSFAPPDPHPEGMWCRWEISI
jgi:hypothetical protein